MVGVTGQQRYDATDAVHVSPVSQHRGCTAVIKVYNDLLAVDKG